jgi:hypothetical protein
MTPEIMTVVVYGSIALALVAILWQRREALTHAAKYGIKAALFGVVAGFVLDLCGLPKVPAFVTGVVFALLVFRATPKRSRHIPARVRRQVIANWEGETGLTYNRRIHEIDHIHPHSLGGGNHAGNLQILHRKKNRSKGARTNWKDREDRNVTVA